MHRVPQTLPSCRFDSLSCINQWYAQALADLLYILGSIGFRSLLPFPAPNLDQCHQRRCCGLVNSELYNEVSLRLSFESLSLNEELLDTGSSDGSPCLSRFLGATPRKLSGAIWAMGQDLGSLIHC